MADLTVDVVEIVRLRVSVEPAGSPARPVGTTADEPHRVLVIRSGVLGVDFTGVVAAGGLDVVAGP